ncbi:uncharacterized protein PHALS_09665 [Plasmopara halstedii]|uniref:Uncharacterized protein n=1 Tax=Plasmopara halstedii TaxID=4781 RepID=A0A0P1AEL0_PLAHL|nr:uncharacterized protein PHALS_09665 [Plasmopara halstedii]CEG39417.1 hypothetical protein PHALS_09665 [Plasmopara halstedii]|eukprot:XP_024575786.1 hypothetical protein PHALS_09665 [Plasmopara halstedii]
MAWCRGFQGKRQRRQAAVSRELQDITLLETILIYCDATAYTRLATPRDTQIVRSSAASHPQLTEAL